MEYNKKKTYFYIMFGICLLVLVLRWVDLHFFTESATSFVTKGSVWVRYIPLLLLAGLSYLLARYAAERPRALLHRCTPLGLCMMITGTVLAAVGLADVSPLLERGATAIQYADCFVPLLAALWFWRFSAKAFTGPTGRGAELPNAVSGLLPVIYYAWLLIHRFAVEPAALVRVSSTVRILGAAAALLFLPPLLRVFMTPGEPVGRALYATGMNVFLLGTCCELLQAGYEVTHGTATISMLMESVSVASLGLCGLACAWYAMGDDITKITIGQNAE